MARVLLLKTQLNQPPKGTPSRSQA